MIYEDKISCIKLSKNDKYQARTKHITVKFHNVKQMRDNGVIFLHYCPSKLMTADVLTKPLPKPQFDTFRFTTASVTPTTFRSKVGVLEKKITSFHVFDRKDPYHTVIGAEDQLFTMTLESDIINLSRVELTIVIPDP